MTSVLFRRLSSLVFFVAGLLLLLVLLLGTPSPLIYVHSSGGGSVSVGNGVLVPPDEVSSGQRVRVVTSPLEMSTRGDTLRMRFRPGSRLRVERVYRDPTGLRLAHLEDTGSSYTSGPAVYHRWGRDILVQQRGRLSWSSPGSGWRCARGSDFEGYWLTGENRTATALATRHAASHEKRPSCRTTGGAGPFPLRPKPPDYQRHVGALMPAEKLITRLVRSARRGEPPKTLRDALGYWAFDRWGELYLYEPRERGFRLTSAGPDGAFHSEDDRRWTRRLSDSSN